MARIAGVDLPKSKRVEIGLCSIYGIGRSVSQRILAQTGVDLIPKSRILARGMSAGFERLSIAITKWKEN